MPDPNAPTPGTENQIDYDRLGDWSRTSASEDMFCTRYLFRALVKKARQRDRAEKEIEANIAAYSEEDVKYGLTLALDALRREP